MVKAVKIGKELCHELNVHTRCFQKHFLHNLRLFECQMQNICGYLVESELIAPPINHLHRFLTKRVEYSNGLYYKDLRAHYCCVNAIEFSKQSQSHFISAGDDKRVLLWNINDHFFSSSSDNQTIRKNRPRVMPGQHNSNIFTLAWDNEDQRIFSGGNDHQVIVHQADTGQICDIFLHEKAVLGIAVHPKQSQIFATACESGELSLYDLRLSNTDPIILSSTRSSTSANQTNGAFHTCAFNPVDPNMLAAGHEIKGLSLFDLRTKSVLMRYKSDDDKITGSTYKQNVMSVFFNQSGNLLGALRFRNRPVIYGTSHEEPVIQFDHEEFSNCCTTKSGCFMGDNDEYLVTGSDDFSVYVWRVPSNRSSQSSLNTSPHLILKSHRSIVNQCRFNSRFYMLATSGVEKVIKVWSPYLLPGSSGGSMLKENEPVHKPIHTGYEPTLEALRNRERSQIVDENDSMLEEDQMVIAYFDAQVKRVRGDLGMSDPVREDESNHSFESLESDLSASTLSSLDTSLSESSSRKKKKSMPRVRESSSSQSKSSSEEVSADEDINIDHLLVDNAAKARRDRSKRNIKLRNKLRNLRHRRSLNLTEESDYLNVLGSLNVSTGGEAQEEDISSRLNQARQSTSSASFIGQPSIEIGQVQLESGCNSDETIDLIPKSSTSCNSTLIRSLNEHKRKLELAIEEKEDTKLSDESNHETDTQGLRFKKRAKDKKINYRRQAE